MKYNFDEVIDRSHNRAAKYDERMKKFGREDALSVAKYFGLSSASLGVDYSGEADALPEVSLQSILTATVRDKTETGYLPADFAECRL